MSTATRPDITYTVSNVAKYCSNLSKQHWTAVKRNNEISQENKTLRAVVQQI